MANASRYLSGTSILKWPQRIFSPFRPLFELLCEEDTRASVGFTMIELVVVIGIVGTLASISIPSYYGYIEKARNTKVVSEMRLLEKEILLFESINGRLPEDLDEIGRGDVKDPWGNPYQYVNVNSEDKKDKDKMRKNRFMHPINTDFDLYSMGPDGKTTAPLTANVSHDDIIRADNGQYLGTAKFFSG